VVPASRSVSVVAQNTILPSVLGRNCTILSFKSQILLHLLSLCQLGTWPL